MSTLLYKKLINSILFHSSLVDSTVNVYLIKTLEKIKTNIQSEQPSYFSQRHGSMVVLCMVQRLLEELKQSNPINVTSHIFRFENWCLQLAIMDATVCPNITHAIGNIGIGI